MKKDTSTPVIQGEEASATDLKVVEGGQSNPVSAPVTDKKKKPNRSLEELHQASIKGMSESELRAYATALREGFAAMEVRANSMEGNAKSAYEKCRVLEQKLIDLKNEANTKLHFVKQAVATLHSSVIFAGTLKEE